MGVSGGLLSTRCRRLEAWLASPEFPQEDPWGERNAVETHRSGCLLKELLLQVILCCEKSPLSVSVKRIRFPSGAPFIIKNHRCQVISSFVGHQGLLCHLKLREILIEGGRAGGGVRDVDG